MWDKYIRVQNIGEAIKLLAELGDTARIVAGATDLMLEMERGARKNVHTLIDITSVQGFNEINIDQDNIIHIGPLVTHNACVGSDLLREHALPLVMACWEVGSPQIRNRGTIAGNLITASPANDTISPLMALNARVTLQSLRGKRIVPLNQFYSGLRRTVMEPDEVLIDISFKALQKHQIGAFKKFALRKAQAISLINMTVILNLDVDQPQLLIKDAAITLGAVAPTIIHAREAEEFLTGKELDENVIDQAAELTMKAAKPINDIRSSANYRKTIVKVVAKRMLRTISEGKVSDSLPEKPVLLWGLSNGYLRSINKIYEIDNTGLIRTTINGKAYEFKGGQGKSLMRLLRENALLTGTKEGCAEGECGACTVHLDGVAVMSCMVPAERAHGSEITTVEGLSDGDNLSLLQSEFAKAGAVQCGYCTPGLLMSATKLLEEKPHPTEDQIKQAITGNLCRCTGYYKIVEAIENASKQRD